MIPALLERLERRIVGYGSHRAVVAFSGGVDSAMVTALAARALGPERVTAVTAVSPSYPAGELESARETVAALAVAHTVVETREVEREAYARNDAMRCYHCKAELYGVLRRIAAEARGSVVLAGANADDQLDVRPGLMAAEQQGVRNPLLEEGVGKADVRALAAHLGLAVAGKPALACLSSRLAFGIRITPDLLARIDRAEQAVRALGFDPFKGYRRKERNLRDSRVREAIKEIAQMDGAFVVARDGTVEAACRIIDAPNTGLALPKGLGTRHWAAAAITNATNALAVVVSQSTGTVRLFQKGEIILRIAPMRHARAMKWQDAETEPVPS